MTPTFSIAIFVVGAGLAVAGQLMVLRDGILGRTPAAGASPGARVREALWIAIPAIAVAATLWATWRALPHHEAIRAAPASVSTPRIIS